MYVLGISNRCLIQQLNCGQMEEEEVEYSAVVKRKCYS